MNKRNVGVDASRADSDMRHIHYYLVFFLVGYVLKDLSNSHIQLGLS